MFGKVLSTTFHGLFLHSEIYDHEHGCVSSGLRQSLSPPPSPPSTSLRKVLSCPVHVPITLRGAECAKAAQSERHTSGHGSFLSKADKKSCNTRANKNAVGFDIFLVIPTDQVWWRYQITKLLNHKLYAAG